MKARRLYLTADELEANANIVVQYPIQRADWIWTPERLAEQGPVVLDFRRDFVVDQPTKLTVHLSADERYEAWVDGEFLSAGPHRSDLSHWSFVSFELELSAGDHAIEVKAWQLGVHAPTAQISGEAGLIVAVDERPDLNTGRPGWRVRNVARSRF